MDALAALLNQSLNHTQAKAAERQLRDQETQPGFSVLLLQLVASAELPLTTRLAGALFFKNMVKRLWVDEDGQHRLPEPDVNTIKGEVIGLMIAVPPAIQAQLGEAVSVIADSDFPDRWPQLVPSLVERLGSDPKVNNGVLTVAHSIFKRWRPLFRSDDLFREIALVLNQFTTPYLQLVLETSKMIDANAGNKTALLEYLQTMNLLVKIYYDLNSQDLPEFFEDHLKQFMDVLHTYLVYTNPLAETDDDDEAGVLENIKAGICEVLQLYGQRYEEEFSPYLPMFVEATWNLLTTIGPAPKYDLLVNRALAFLTSVAKLDRHVHMFASPEVLSQLVEKIVIPNMAMRTSDEELFEDDPIEFIRRDLEGSDSDTRRRAATDFLRELATKREAEVTEIVMKYIKGFLAEYQQNPAENWRAKNTAGYLFSSIAAKGNFTAAGVSTTNLLIDVVGFFNTSIAPDLMAANVNPILQVDAIRFIHNFRNQLTKQQLSQALPLLVQLLSSSEYVVYTYSAITIERILSIRVDGRPMFTQDDVQRDAAPLVSSLMQLVLRQSATPEKLAENEFLIKCVMRVLVTVEQGMAPFAGGLLGQLVQIMSAISANPSNPRFTHFLFECIGAVVKYDGAHIGDAKLQELVVEPCFAVLGNDVTEFVPYVLQILTQVLQLQPVGTLPPAFHKLVRPLMAPVLWEPRGNVPALVGMVEALLSHGGPVIVQDNLLTPLLGVFQNLLSSRVNDAYSLELLEYIFLYIPVNDLRPYAGQIAQLLLVRLQKSRTPQFLLRFARFIYFLAANQLVPLGPDFAIQFIDQVQPGVFGQVFDLFLPSTLKIHGNLNRRVAAAGLTNLLCQTEAMTTGAYASKWPAGIQTLVGLLKTNVAEEAAPAVEQNAEERTFGSSFSKLSTVSVKPLDPIPRISNATDYFREQITQLAGKMGPGIQGLIANVDEESREYLKGLGL